MPESKASALVLKHIKESALKLFGTKRGHFIATTPQSNPVLQEHIDVLTDFDPDREIDAESMAAMAELSRLLDYVQDGDAVFSGTAQSPDLLSDQYLSVLKNVEFARANPNDDSREKYERALRKLYSDPEAPYIFKTDAYQEFVSLRTKIERDKIARNELVLRLAAAGITESVIQEIREDIQQYDNSIAAQESLLNALDREHDFSQTEALLEASRVAGFPKSYENVASIFDVIYRVGNPVSGTTYVRCEFSPNRLAEQNWAPVLITADEIQAASRPGETPQSLAPPIRAAQQLSDEDIESVEFEIQTLSVDRPWLWTGLFENKLWRWRVDDGPISDGKGSPQGKIPAYVVGMVFVRNLKVKGKQKMLKQTDVSATSGMSTNLRLGNLVFSTQQAGPKFTRTLHGVKTSSQGTQRLTPAVKFGTAVAGGRAATRHFSATKNLRVSVNKDARAYFARRQKHKSIGINGVVRDINQQVLEGVAISVQQTNGTQRQSMITPKSGRFGFQLRSTGNYKITAVKKGYASHTQSVQLNNSQSLKIQLKGVLVSQVVRNQSTAMQKGFVQKGLQKSLQKVVAVRKVLPPASRVKVPPHQSRKVPPPGASRVPRPRSGRVPPPRTTPIGQHWIYYPSNPTLRAKFLLTSTAGGGANAYGEVRLVVKSVKQGVVNTLSPNASGEVKVSLMKGQYKISVRTDQHIIKGQGEKTINLQANQEHQFILIPKAVLSSDEIHLVGFVCQQVPMCPQPDPNAIWAS